MPWFKNRLFVGGMLAAIGLAGFLLFAPHASSKEEMLQSVKACQGAERVNTCYKALSERFVAEDELPLLFEMLEENQQDEHIFRSCHVLLHFAGQAAYKKYENVSDTLKQGNYVCFAGYYHGSLEGYFIENHLLVSDANGLEALAEKVPEICEEGRLEVKRDYYECLHGLGHGLMFATDGELPQALRLCDSLGDKSKAQWCYSGAFMENSTSTTNPDHPSKYMREDDPLYPCNILDEKYAHTCYTLQSMYFVHHTQGNWPEAARLCEQTPLRQHEACFEGLGQSAAGYSAEPEKIRDICLSMPESYHNSCILGAVGASGEKYKPPFPVLANLCSVFLGEDNITCYTGVFRSMRNWTNDQGELRNFCQTIDNASLKAQCLSHLGS